jgi:hypothetical protein
MVRPENLNADNAENRDLRGLEMSCFQSKSAEMIGMSRSAMGFAADGA